MKQVTTIGIDLAKRSFQLHGAGADGSVVFREKVSREKLLGFLSSQPRCTVAMEACASAHYWGREISQLGHEVRLIPPIYGPLSCFTNSSDNVTTAALSNKNPASRSCVWRP